MRREHMKRCGWISVLMSALALSGSLSAADQTTNVMRPGVVATNALESRLFQFGGGNFDQFMTKLRDEFGKEVYELIEIRAPEPHRIQVPKMKVPALDIRSVFITYNRISKEGGGFLGNWIYSPTDFFSSGKRIYPDTIIFLGPKGGGGDVAGGIQVRAFSIRGLSPDSTKALEDLIRQESRQLQQEIAYRSGDPASAEGRVNIHQATGLLIASGGKTYVDLVSTLMDAFVTKDRVTGEALKSAPQETKPPPPAQTNPKVAKPQ